MILHSEEDPEKVRVKNKVRSMGAKFSIEDIEKEKVLGNGKRNEQWKNRWTRVGPSTC